MGCSAVPSTTSTGSTGSNESNASSGAGTDDSPASGSSTGGPTPSRLVKHMYDAGDGVTRFREIWDRELEHYCSIRHASDGEPRCLPLTFSSGIYYTDAACTKPVGVDFTDCGSPYAVGTVFSGGCDEPEYAVYRLGEPIKQPDMLYASYSDSCDAVESFPGSFFEVSAVEPGTFLGVDVEERPAVDGLIVREAVTPAGARFHYDVRRSSDGERCDPDVEYEACLPSGARSFDPDDDTVYYADASCAAPATDYRHCKPPFALDVVRPEEDCGRYEYRYFRLGGNVDPVFESDGLSCSPLAFEAPFGFAEIGEQLALQPVEVVSVGSGAITALRLQDSSGETVAENFRLFDSGRPCSPLLEAGETYRCVGDDDERLSTSTRYFADGNCSRGLVSHGGCRDAPRYAYQSEVAEASCLFDRVLGQVYEIGPRHDGVTYELVDGACTEAELSKTTTVFTFGDPVGHDVFPLLTVVEG